VVLRLDDEYERRCSNGRMGVILVVCLCVLFARWNGAVMLRWSLFSFGFYAGER